MRKDTHFPAVGPLVPDLIADLVADRQAGRDTKPLLHLLAALGVSLRWADAPGVSRS